MYPKWAGGNAARARGSKSMIERTWSADVTGGAGRPNTLDGVGGASAIARDPKAGKATAPPMNARRVNNQRIFLLRPACVLRSLLESEIVECLLLCISMIFFRPAAIAAFSM